MEEKPIIEQIIWNEVFDSIIIIFNSIGQCNDEAKYENELIKSLKSLGRSYKTNIKVNMKSGQKHFIDFVIEESIIVKFTTEADKNEIEECMNEYLTKTKTTLGFLVNINTANVLQKIKRYKT